MQYYTDEVQFLFHMTKQLHEGMQLLPDWAYSPVEFDVTGVGGVKLVVAKTTS